MIIYAHTAVQCGTVDLFQLGNGTICMRRGRGGGELGRERESAVGTGRPRDDCWQSARASLLIDLSRERAAGEGGSTAATGTTGRYAASRSRARGHWHFTASPLPEYGLHNSWPQQAFSLA